MTPPPRRQVVLLLAPTLDDATARSLQLAVQSLGAEPLVVATRSHFDLSLDPGAMAQSSLQGVWLSEVVGAFVHALPPRFGALLWAHQKPRHARFWLRHQVPADGKRDALCAVLSWLEDEGRSVLNPPRGGTLLVNKLHQLRVAAMLGLQIPPTQWTVSDDDAARFFEDQTTAGEVVLHKPVRAWGGAERLTAPRADAGRIVQRRELGTPVRVVMLRGEVLSACRIEGTHALDHRADPVYARGEARYVAVDVEPTVRRQLATLQETLGYPFAGADFMETAGGWVFLELNAAPVFLEQQLRLGHPIAERVAMDLLSHGRSPPPLSDDEGSRPE